jgi:L-rhamnose-H+ transport protein
MLALGLTFAFLSGVANGLFTAPMKMIRRWKWENIWLVFIVVACLVMPAAMVLPVADVRAVFAAAPRAALTAAFLFGFLWGFGAILFGRSVDRLGVSLANTLVIGLSSALGSAVPLILGGAMRADARTAVLLAGVATFIVGVWLCGSAGRIRAPGRSPQSWGGFVFAIGAGVMSAIFNIGYSLALPVAAAGRSLGYSGFVSTNCIWVAMLGAGAVPNVAYCVYLMRRNSSAGLFAGEGSQSRSWVLAMLMGVLWGGSIFLYGAATPLLGDIGPSIGWPLSLAVGLLVANSMGLLLGEWRGAAPAAVSRMRVGIAVLLVAIVFCAVASRLGA